MLQKIIGRKEEQKTLQDCYESNKPEFVAVYGRRRIGKTFLVKQFFKEEFDFYFTGAYQATKKDQLFNFKMTLESYSGVKRKTPQTWLEAFFQLKDYLASLGDRRKVVFIDELPWFDTPRSNFISAIELFWNQWASDQNLMLVVCGSATSWMVNKLLGDKGGLHNRVTRSIYLAPFSLGETEEFLQNNHIVFNRHQTVECYMMLGGTPYYLNMLKPHLSLAQNINKLFFEEMAEHNGLTYEETLEQLKLHYDGYHFSINSEDIFNPYSIINALDDKEFNSYWFTSGTPTFLVELLQQKNLDMLNLDDLWVNDDRFDTPTEKLTDPIPVLFQSGYLTIKGYERRGKLYHLCFPNQEVRQGFSDCLCSPSSPCLNEV
jgi:hypothetical protein